MMERYNGVGERADRPFRLCGISSSMSFGEYVNALLFINCVAAQFDHSLVTFIYKDDADFKTPLLRTVRFKNVLKVPVFSDWPPLDLFILPFRGTAGPPLSAWFENQLNDQHFVITDSMVSAPLLCSFEPLAHLQFAEEDVPELGAQLTSFGLDPNRWYCALHHRESGYQHKPKGRNFRDTDPQRFMKLSDFIIDHLGGQVVRLGHPEMTPFPSRSGFVDLSRIPSSTLLQAFAASRARFMFTTPSGPIALGHSFNVPNARSNVVDFWQAARQDLLSTVEVVLANGTVLRQNALYESGLQKPDLMRGLADGSIKQVIQNSFEQMAELATAMFKETVGVDRWRSPAQPVLGQRPNSFQWPRQAIKKARFL